MNDSLGRHAGSIFAAIALVAVVGALFKIVTAPDRIQERRNTAKAVCAAGGGVWAEVDKVEACVGRTLASQH
jgi:hypothetical protein